MVALTMIVIGVQRCGMTDCRFLILLLARMSSPSLVEKGDWAMATLWSSWMVLDSHDSVITRKSMWCLLMAPTMAFFFAACLRDRTLMVPTMMLALKILSFILTAVGQEGTSVRELTTF